MCDTKMPRKGEMQMNINHNNVAAHNNIQTEEWKNEN